MGGVFIDSPQDKLTACFYPDGSKTVCDANGQDCENYPPPPPKPKSNVTGGVEGPFGGFGWEATTDVGETVDPSPATSAANGVTAPPVEGAEARTGSGKRRGRRGKRRKK